MPTSTQVAAQAAAIPNLLTDVRQRETHFTFGQEPSTPVSKKKRHRRWYNNTTRRRGRRGSSFVSASGSRR